jgi:DegT/DnrJ/EryC1/StrS aminotransferase family
VSPVRPAPTTVSSDCRPTSGVPSAHAPRDESHHLAGRSVEPLRVLRDEQERRPLGGFTEEVQGREAIKKRSEGSDSPIPNAGSERVALTRRQAPKVCEQRRQQLMQTGERQMSLRLHSTRSEDLHSVGNRASARRLEQRRFANRGLAANNDCPAAAFDCVDQLFEGAELGLAPPAREARSLPRPSLASRGAVRALLAEVEGVTTLCPDDADHRLSWLVYVVFVEEPHDRDMVMVRLAAQGVSSKPYLPAIHLQPLYRERFGFRPGMFPVAERAGARGLPLPFTRGSPRTLRRASSQRSPPPLLDG